MNETHERNDFGDSIKKLLIIAQTAPTVCYEELLLQCFSDAYETDYEFEKVGNSSTQNFKEEHDALTIIMMILGISFNLIVVIVWLQDETKYRTSSSLFLIHMTLANILSTSLFPFGSGNRVMGVEVCGLGQPVKCVSSIISMLMVTLMAVDRWRSITTNPVTTWSRKSFPRQVHLTCLAIWFVAFLSASPLFSRVSIRFVDSKSTSNICEEWKTGEGDWNLAKQSEMNEEEICNCAPSNGDFFFSAEFEKEEKIKTLTIEDCLNWGIWRDPQLHFSTWKSKFPDCEKKEDPCKSKIWKNIDMRCGCPSSGQKKILSWYLMIIMLVVPFVIITWCYIKIIKSAKFLAKKLGQARSRGKSIGSTPRLNRQLQSPIASQCSSSSALSSMTNVQRPQLSTKSHHNNRQRRISEFNSNLNLMVFLMVIAVVVCWLPFHVLNLSWAYGLRVTTSLCEFLQSSARFLTWFHPLVNCLLYSFMGKKFRKELRHTLKRIKTISGPRGSKSDPNLLSLRSSLNSRRASASRSVL